MKAIKLIIMFIVVLGGVLGGIFLVTSGGGGDVPDPSPYTNVLPDTTTTEDSANSSAPLPGAQDEDKVDPNRETEQAEETKKETASGNAPFPGAQDENKDGPTIEGKADSSKKCTKQRYTCERCGPDRWFCTNGELQNHIRTNHKKSEAITTKFVCEICKKGLKTQNQLEKHIEMKHEE